MKKSIVVSVKSSMHLMLLLFSVLSFLKGSAQNPALPFGADPDITYFAQTGKYYIYPTGGNAFHAYSSSDLTNWHEEGVILDLPSQVPWGTSAGWAPCMIFRNNKYYFYFSASFNIGVAIGNSPVGPFTEIVHLLGPTDVTVMQTIDPMVFVDVDGSAYIYYGGSFGARMGVRKLNTDMKSFDYGFGFRDLTPPNYTEAPHIFKRGPLYHLTYSNGSFANGTYNVQYCTALSPLGPWVYQGNILSNRGPFTGNGHHGIVKHPNCDEYYIAYHRYENGDYSTRRVAVDRLYFEQPSGAILPVNQTWASVPARPPGAGCINPRPIADGTYYIQSRVNSTTGQPLVLQRQSCSSPVGSQVYTGTPNTSCNYQKWTITYSNNFYKIVSAEPGGYSLDLGNGNFNSQAPIGVWYDMVSDNQRWRIEETSTPGYFRIINKLSGYVLDFSSAIPPSLIISYPWLDNDSQRWKFSSTLPISLASSSQNSLSLATDNPAHESGDAIKLTVYPNPAKRVVNISYRMGNEKVAASSKIIVQLFNQQGQLVRSKDYQVEPSGNLKFNIESITKGTYFVTVRAGEVVLGRKQVVVIH